MWMAEINTDLLRIRWRLTQVIVRHLGYGIQTLIAFENLTEYNRLYRTGDYASVLKGGMIQYEGRTDSQIKIRGHRVDLSEIEKNLFTIDEIDKGIVLCYRAGEFDQALLAFVTVIDGSKMQYGMQIENILKTKLADYMVPQVIIVESIPLLVNGKIDRQGLLKLYENANNNGKSLWVKGLDWCR